MTDVDPAVRDSVRETLKTCDQRKMDELIFNLILDQKVTSEDLEDVLHEEIVASDETVKNWWHGPCGHPECRPEGLTEGERIGMLRFKVGDEEQDIGWSGEWPPPAEIVRVQGQMTGMVAYALHEDLRSVIQELSAEEALGFDLQVYGLDVVAPLDDHPHFHAAAVYVAKSDERPKPSLHETEPKSDDT